MYCLKPFLINNDLLFSFVSNKNGVAVKLSHVLLTSYCHLEICRIFAKLAHQKGYCSYFWNERPRKIRDKKYFILLKDPFRSIHEK